jgi:hypothetical protein
MPRPFISASQGVFLAVATVYPNEPLVWQNVAGIIVEVLTCKEISVRI